MTALTRHLPAPVTDRDVATIEAQVRKIATSALVPDALRGKPADILLIGLKARELGVDRLTVALQHIISIKGSICLSAQMCVALARRAGHDLWVEEYGPTSVTVAGSVRQHPQRVTKVTWTIDMAKTAKLTDKDVWRSFPQAMLFARASKDWVKMNCPEVMMGLDDGAYSFEDIAGLPDEAAPGEVHGQVVDDTVDAELVEPDLGAEQWAARWTQLCREARCDRETSRWLLSQAVGGRVDRAADVPEDLRDACEAALARWDAYRRQLEAKGQVADMAAPFDEEPADA